MNLRSRVDGTLRRREMLKGGERVLVAVSGGPDSLALLLVLNELAPAWRLDLHLAHFDHRLRPNSGADAAYVARVARRLGLPVTTGSASPEPIAAGLSPEEAARDRRLGFLEAVADVVAADRIATGHTLDDQAETMLMRLLIGAGARGLGGIPPVRGRFVRPLIDVGRGETEAYCRAKKFRPRRDPTNDDPAFLRNAIRNEALPFLASRFNARLSEALARAADALREEDILLDRLAADAIEIGEERQERTLSIEALNALPLALRRRAVRIALGAPVEMAHIEKVLDLCAAGRSGDTLNLPEGLNARLEYGSLLLGRAPSQASPAEPVGLTVPGRTSLPMWDAVATVWEQRETPTVWPDGKGTCVVDADTINAPLLIRTRRAGDRIAPLGTKGTKTVADLLTEEKVPRHQRDRVPLLVSGDGNDVVWVVGHRVSERHKVTGETQRYLWVSFEGGRSWRS
ncbi:MAG: tRNA lysidine(34) synthetase TilS [Actinomycetota bacterium]|nr:tRNA lysidine(34) synthetase TilS [Actinomycetota bacterium]